METLRKLDLFPSSGEEETPTVLGPLERVNFNHWTTELTSVCLAVPHLLMLHHSLLLHILLLSACSQVFK
jgi:hypothetical protein